MKAVITRRTAILPTITPLDEILENAASLYRSEKLAFEVDFRKLSPFPAGADRATHLIHPYPAKLLLNIPHSFLSSRVLTKNAESVLDPFCGSGTVLLEGLLAGFRVDGSDSNPLARLISTAKTRPLDPALLVTQLNKAIAAAPKAKQHKPDVVNLDYWFYPRIAQALGRLATAIREHTTVLTRTFFDVCFSSCVRRLSLADPRLSVPVRINPDRAGVYGAKGDEVILRLEKLKTADVRQTFWSICNQNIVRMRRLIKLLGANHYIPNIGADARHLSASAGAYDLVITSPPYVGAQKYIRSSGLSLGWLGLTPSFDLRSHERRSIGREHLTVSERLARPRSGITEADKLIDVIAAENGLRADIASVYLKEMSEALQEAARVTRPGGYLVLIAGSNVVTGRAFDTPRYLQEIAERLGFVTAAHLLDDIRSRGLMVKRNRTASIITQESVFIMRRDG